MRYKHEKDEILKNLEKLIPIYYTNRKAKLTYLLEEINVIPDLWIDDNPNFIFNNAK